MTAPRVERQAGSGHTPGPWTITEKRAVDERGAHLVQIVKVKDHSDKSIFGRALLAWVPAHGGARDEAIANAARIVACVNACEGVPTEMLAGHDFATTAKRLVAQRDELAKALLDLGFENPDGPCFDSCQHYGLNKHSPACEAARAALSSHASTKGRTTGDNS